VERPHRKVRFARLIQRRVRDLGGPAVRAAYGGDLRLPWLPLTVVRHRQLDRAEHAHRFTRLRIDNSAND
jgi:hypothetical protein